MNKIVSPITLRQRIVKEFSHRGVVGMPELLETGASRGYIENLIEQGDLVRVGRGLFRVAGAPITKHHALVEVAQHAPNAVICLASALQFYNLTTQLPAFVWVAVPNHRRAPKVPTVGVEVVHMSDEWLATGVDVHQLEGVPVRIFSVPKTICDGFKYKTYLGTSVAIEALRDALEQRATTRDQIYCMAKSGGLWDRMRPYLESLS